MKYNKVDTTEMLHTLAEVVSEMLSSIEKACQEDAEYKKEVRVTAEQLNNNEFHLHRISYMLYKEGCCRDCVVDYLRILYKASKGAFLDLVMQEIAVALDLRYGNHISDSPVLYVYNKLNSKIVPVNPNAVSKKAYAYFPAFRTKEDAIFAINKAYEIKNLIFND